MSETNSLGGGEGFYFISSKTLKIKGARYKVLKIKEWLLDRNNKRITKGAINHLSNRIINRPNREEITKKWEDSGLLDYVKDKKI